MAMFRPVDTTGNALQNIIPLLMQKKRDQEELAYKDRLLQVKQQKLQAEADERAQRLKDKAAETKLNYLKDMYKTGVEKGDPGLAQQFGTPLQEMGFPVATQEQPSSELDMTGEPNLKWLVAQPQLTGEAKNLETILGRRPTLEDLKALKEKEGLTGTARNLEVLLNRKPTLQELKDFESNPGLTGTAKNLEILLGRKPTLQELKEHGRTEADTQPRAIKAYKSPDGKVAFLPNNEVPPVGYEPYSEAGKIEERLNKSQELTSIRQDKAYLKREISRIKSLPDLDFYKGQKERLPSLMDELLDLEGREGELLGNKNQPPEQVDPSTGAAEKLPEGLTDETIKFNMEKYGKSREQVIEQYKKRLGGK